MMIAKVWRKFEMPCFSWMFDFNERYKFLFNSYIWDVIAVV